MENETKITPSMVRAAKKVLWDSERLKGILFGVDDILVERMLVAALKAASQRKQFLSSGTRATGIAFEGKPPKAAGKAGSVKG